MPFSFNQRSQGGQGAKPITNATAISSSEGTEEDSEVPSDQMDTDAAAEDGVEAHAMMVAPGVGGGGTGGGLYRFGIHNGQFRIIDYEHLVCLLVLLGLINGDDPAKDFSIVSMHNQSGGGAWSAILGFDGDVH